MARTLVVSREPRHAEDIAAALPDATVLHATDATRLPVDGRVIAVLPRAEIASILDWMTASEHVIALHVDDVPFDRLRALANRAVLPHLTKVGTFHERSRAIADVVRFAERAGVPRAVLAAIEQCVDELLVNALYDAPVDEHGKRVFAGVPVHVRATQRVAQDVELAYGCDAEVFSVSVRDAFGSLERAAVLKFLGRGFEQQIDRKQGGAGLGLYLLLHNASTVAFRVTPGRSTEVTCTFPLVSKPQLEQLSLEIGEPVEPRAFAPHVVPVASPQVVRRRRRLIVALATLALLGGVLAVALPRLLAVTPTATLELDTVPSGAAVTVGGKPMGGTPLRLGGLSPGAKLSIAFAQRGYRDVAIDIPAPPANETKRVVQSLERSDRFASVRVSSEPPGAQILLDNKPLASRTFTPATIFVEANQPQHLALVMPGHVPVELDPIVAAPRTTIETSATLVAGHTLRIEGRGGRVTVEGAPGCTDRLVPATCSLAAGSYAVVWVDGVDRITRTVQLAGDVIERF